MGPIGPTGPTGPVGVTGPTGPTGPATSGVPVYLQQTQPAGSGWVWFVQDGSGNVIDIWSG